MFKQVIQQTNQRLLTWFNKFRWLIIDNPNTWFGKISLAISLFLVSTTANAGFVPIVAAVGSLLGFSGAAAVVVGVIAIGAAVYASVAFLGYLGMKMPDLSSTEEANKQAEGVQIQRRGSVEQIPIVYGHRRIAGIVSFATTGSDKNKYLWVCYTFCEGPIEGLQKIYIDDWDFDTDNPTSKSGYVAGYLNAWKNTDGDAGKPVKITWGKYKNRVQLMFSKGTYYTDPRTSTINDDILGSGNVFDGVPTETNGYKTSMVHNGLVTLWARYEWIAGEDNPFTGSIPLIHVEILGKKVTPLWRQSDNSNYSNPYNVEVTGTYSGAYGTNEQYSTNPVECLLDYLRNPRYGKGLANSEIHWDTWSKAAKKCYQMVPSSIAGETHPIMTLNAVVQTDSTIMNNVKNLLQNFRAYMPYHQGKYKLRIEDAGNATDILSGVATVVRTFTPDNIVGDVTYTGIERSAKYNQVVLQYVEPEEKFTNQTVLYPDPAIPSQLTLYNTVKAQDGNRDYVFEITLPGITNRDMAVDMAKLIFNKSRYQETCTLTVTSEAFNIELGDNIYIASKVLNFTNDANPSSNIPWRVVSIQLQDNHSVQLQCVRNPDWIYPWVRPGEKDIVLPTYIPKGADRILPPNIELYPSGIVPPTRATLPPGVSSGDEIIAPAPSNVAVSNSSVSSTTVSSPLVDTVTITGARTIYISGQAYLILTWRQPSIAMFKSLAMTVTPVTGPGTSSPQFQAEYVGSPSDGEVVEFQIPTAVTPSTTYDIVSRVKYSTGQQSTVTTTFTVSSTADTSITAPITSDTVETTSGTTAPSATETTTTPTTSPTYSEPATTDTTPVVAPAPAPRARDDYCSVLSGEITQAGFDAEDKEITIYLTLTNEGKNNPDIIGFNFWIKANVDTYWIPFEGRVDGNVIFNPQLVTEQAITLGGYGNTTVYDMIVRVAYKDGTESTKQQRFTFNLKSPSNVYPYDFLYGLNEFATPTPLQDTSSYNPQPFPPGYVGTASQIKMNIASTRYSGNDGIMITMNPPALADRAYWYGQTVRYRPFTPGTNPPFITYLDSTSWATAAGPGGAVYVTPTIRPITYNQKYEIVVTPYVKFGGTKQDSHYSWFGVGYVNNATTSTIYPADDNWNFNFNWQNVPTSTALQTINSAFAPPVMTDATVQLSKFETVSNPNWYATTTFDNGTSFELTSYHSLSWSGVGITDFKGVRIYRRTNTGTASETTGTTAKYYGWGRWEYIDTTATSINLRGPTAYQEFNPRYQVSGYTGSAYSSLLNLGYQSAYNGLLLNNGKNQIATANSGSQQYLIVVQFNDDSFSTKGLLINCARCVTSSPNPYNQLKPNLPSVVSLSSLNNYTAGYSRNLSDARAVLASTAIGVTAAQPYAPGGTTASITKFVTYPSASPTVQ